jgi:hypothetical protein
VVPGHEYMPRPPIGWSSKAKEERFPDHRMLYAYFPTDKGLFTVRLVGPAKTVEQNKKGFDEWVKNFK